MFEFDIQRFVEIINGTNDSDSITVEDHTYYFNNNVEKRRQFSIDGDAAVVSAYAGNDNITIRLVSFSTVYGGDGDDYFLGDVLFNVVIDCGNGDDEFYSESFLAAGNTNITIYGAEGNDIIDMSISDGYSCIDGGSGNDLITVSSNYFKSNVKGGKDDDIIYIEHAQNKYGTLYQYASGDGNDTIFGVNFLDTIQITSGTYSTLRNENDLIISVGSGAIILKNIPDDNQINIKDSEGNLNWSVMNGTDGNDSLDNRVPNVSIYSYGGNDNIYNTGKNVFIESGDGSDSITNAGDDVSHNGDNVTIDSSSGNDSIVNYRQSVSINSGAGNDYIFNLGNFVTIESGDGDDDIINGGDSVKIDSGEGNDYIDNGGEIVTISSGIGNDFIKNTGDSVTIESGAGNDSIYIYGTIYNSRYRYVSINSGADDDFISLESYKNYSVIEYKNGDGNDTILGLNSDDTLKISGAEYTTTNSGSDLIIGVGSGKITVVGGANAGFTIDGTLKGGGSENETLPTGITVKNSIVTAAKTFTGKEINLADYDANKVNAVALTSGISIIGNAENNSLSGGKGADTISGGAGNDTLTGGAGKDIFVYSAGNDIITDYKTGEDIISATYTNSTVKGSDVILTTANGNLTVKGAKDKVITFDDGNELIFFSNTSYAPLATGLTYDAKRTLLTASNKFTGNEINLENYLSTVTKVNAPALSKAVAITGNDSANSIKGGKGADTISGGAGNDTLTGGAGKDIFIYSAGNDIITDYKSGEDIISATYTNSTVKGSDVILTTANGNLTVKGAKDKAVTFDDGNELIFFSNTSYAPLATGLTYDAKRTLLTASNKFTGAEIDLANYLSTVTKVNASALSKAVEITGNDSANSIKGGKGADTITGGAGNDTLTGGAGKDIFIYSAGNDIITDYKTGEDIISATYTNSTVKGSDVILTTANGNLTVKDAKDKVITFDDGNELIFFSNTSYAPLETGLTYDAKRTMLTASNKFTGNEIDLANYLSTVTKVNAGSAKNALAITGNDSANSIKGGKGADTISGGAGNDTLTGGSGKDTFIYSAGNDVITDYTAGDEIQIDGTISNTSYSGKNVIFTVGNGSLTVKNGKGKNISVTDSSGSQNYSKTLDILYDNNFMTDENNLDSITEEKFSVTQIQNYNEDLAQDENILTFAKEK